MAASACRFDFASDSLMTPTGGVLFEDAIAKKNKANNLMSHLANDSIKVREHGKKSIKVIIWSNDFISAGVSAQP